MNEQQLAEQKRLTEILRLARMQLNEEYMKSYSAAHTTWLAASRSAWTTNGTLLPFTVQFKYPSEEEVVARGVEIYKTLTGTVPKETAPVPKEQEVVAYTPETAFTNTPEPTVEKEKEQEIEVVAYTIETAFTNIPEPTVEKEAADETVTDVEFKEVVEEQPAKEETLLENKFKSLFTKWGGRGSY